MVLYKRATKGNNSQMNLPQYEQVLISLKQSLEAISTTFPHFSKHFERCFENIKKDLYSNSQTTSQGERNTDKKNKLRQQLENSLTDPDTESFNGYISDEEVFGNHQFANVQEMVLFLKRLKSLIDATNRRAVMLSERYGDYLTYAELVLDKATYKQVVENTGYSLRYCKFLIWLHKLCTRYPKMKRSSAGVRTFLSNQKIVEEICAENHAFWSIP